jgi:hypothetical protein
MVERCGAAPKVAGRASFKARRLDGADDNEMGGQGVVPLVEI